MTQRVDITIAVDGEIVVVRHLEVSHASVQTMSPPTATAMFDGKPVEVGGRRDISITLDGRDAVDVEPTRYAESKFDLDVLFGQIPGQLNILLARWFPSSGWMVTRRGIVRHGPRLTDEEVVRLETMAGLRAMTHRAEKDGLDW